MPLSRREVLAAGALLPAALPASADVPVQTPPPKFKLGTVTYNVPMNWDLTTLLKVCKDTGVAAVECRTTHKHGVEPALDADDRKRVKKQFADAGVVFWGCGSVCEFHSDDPGVVAKHVDDCKRFSQLVADLGGKGVKVRPNGVPKGGDPAKTFDQIGKALRECGKVAEGLGVEIWVEVHGAVTQIPKNMRTIMDACGHKAVGVTWNSNAADVENGSVAASFELLKPFIKSCHINDLYNDAAGKYPYRELFRLLKGIGYDRYTLCEVGRPHDPASGAEFFKYYKALWAELARG